MVPGCVLDVLAQLRPVRNPREIIRRNLVPCTATMLSEGDPGQQGRLACPGDQLLLRRQLKQLAEDEGRDVGIRKGSVSTAGDGGVQILWPEPVPQDLIAVTRSFRPKPERRLVGANSRAALEVFSKPLGLKGPLVSDEHVDIRSPSPSI